ncbi:hypothetical protein [Bacillus coreaensis]
MSIRTGTVKLGEGESEWSEHSDRRKSIRVKESLNGVFIRTGAVKLGEGESEWSVHSDRSGETR